MKKYIELICIPIYLLYSIGAMFWFGYILDGNSSFNLSYLLGVFPIVFVIFILHAVADTNFISDHIDFDEEKLTYEIEKVKYCVGFVVFTTLPLVIAATFIILIF